MTKNLTPPKQPPPTPQLDLDSFLRRHNAALTSSSSDEDDAPSTSLHRTVDDILNDSSSSSSSSSDHEKETNLVRSKTLYSISKPPNPAQIKQNLIQRFKSDEFSVFSNRKLQSGSNSRSSSLFGSGLRSTGKPGAALAAAAAASRPFKSRRAVSLSVVEKVLDGGDQLYDFEERGSSGSDVRSESNGDGGGSVVEYSDGSGSVVGSVEVVNEDEESVIERERSVDSEFEDVERSEEVERSGILGVGDGEKEVEVERSGIVVFEGVEGVTEVEESVMPVEEDVGMRYEVDEVANVEKMNNERFDVEDGDGKEIETMQLESVLVLSEVSIGRDDLSSESDEVRELVDELVEDRMGELEGEKDSGKDEEEEEEELGAKKKPLELAEELEKKQASTGQDWEEGAAAQPMKLEGVRSGSTVIGYFDVNADNAISRTVKSQAFRRDYGIPKVLAVHLNYIALGMSKGVIVVVPSKYSAQHGDNFDSKMLLLGAQGDRSLAPVTSICFNQLGDLLLAGYGDGHITFWNLPKGTVAKVVSGEHKAPVVHALFLGQDSQLTRQYKAVTGDCKGLLLLHEISVMTLFGFTVKSQCLLDGQRTGTVLCASPLLPDDITGPVPSTSPGNPSISASSISGVMGGVVGGVAGWKLTAEGSSLSEEGVVIFVTHQNALVVHFGPSVEIYAQIAKPEGVREGAMPYTAWKCTTQLRDSTKESSSTNVLEKISLLAIAWDQKVQVAKLVKSELKMCRKWTLESSAVGLAWLDDQMLVILTLSGQLCLYTWDGILIHQTSYAGNATGGDDLISYHTYFSNAFGNPEKASQNSVAIRGASVYVLGPTHLVVSRLLLWKERIQVLRNAGDWMGAFNMAMTLYDGHAHGVIDLPRDLQAVQEAIMPYLVELLFSYVDEVFSYISVACSNQAGKEEELRDGGLISTSSSASSEIKEQFTRVGGVAVEFCVHIKRTDLLFDDIFSKFIAVHHRDTFLELLEPYILKDMLGSLPPEVMQALVEHYNSKGWLQRVEQCILHMDISSLDFNQVVRLCRENGLYGALIYLFNKGLDDFKTPLEDLLNVLRNHDKDAVSIGYRMLVYLKYCFSGLAFPPGHGAIPSQRLPSLRTELVQFLLEDSGGPKPQTGASLTSTGSYLNLYFLLELDTGAALDVLRAAFVGVPEEHMPDLTSDDNKEGDPIAEDKNVLVQNAVDALVLILDVETSKTVRSSGHNDTRGVWPSKDDIGLLIEFIAGYVASKRAHVSKSVLSQILEYLMSDSYLLSNKSEQMNESKKRGEKNVLALLHAVPETEWNPTYVLHLCEQAQFYQVCGLIHTIKGNYLAALDSYMKYVDEPVQSFLFIESLLLDLSGTESTAFRSAVISRIPELITLSRECTFLLVSSHFNKESGRILSELRANPRSLFLYLKTLVEVHSSGTLKFSIVNVDTVRDVPWSRHGKDEKNHLQHYLQKISEFPKVIRNDPVEITDDLVELYVEMLCQYEPNSVLKFLETFENYRVDHCLQLCQEYEIVDAAAFLLERVGDVGSGLLLILSDLNEKFVMLEAAVGKMISDKHARVDYLLAASGLKEVQDINRILQACIGLCQRNTPRLESEESESLWFHLLDSFCKPLLVCPANSDTSKSTQSSSKKDSEINHITWRVSQSVKYAPVLKRLLSQFVKEIVEGMVGFVCLPSIMSKLLSDNGDQEFGDFKPTILGLLGTYGFERRILDTAKCLIEDDTFYTMTALKKGASKGFAPRSLICCICNCSFGKSSSSSGIRMFSCGHATHLQCELPDSGASSKNSPSGCPICVVEKKTQKGKGKVVEQGLVSTSPDRSWQTRGATVLHSHEFDAFENSRGRHQISRFEMLESLQKNQRVIQTDTMPQLRLAPPAIYHEKVNKRNHFSAAGSSQGIPDTVKQSKTKQLRDLKAKGSSVRFKIFGKEKTRV